MSLIQDGLKRKLGEQKTGAQGATNAAAPLTVPPPPLDVPPLTISLPPPHGGKGRAPGSRRPLILLALLLLIVAGGAAWWFLLGPGAPVAAVEQAVTTPTVPPSPVGKTNSIQERVHAVVTAEQSRVTAIEEAVSTSTPPIVAVSGTGVTSVVATPTNAVSTDAGVAKPVPTNKPVARARAVWPKFSITGILAADRSGSTALINGRLLREGDSFDGVQVIRINARQVELEFDGERRSFSSGQGIK